MGDGVLPDKEVDVITPFIKIWPTTKAQGIQRDQARCTTERISGQGTSPLVVTGHRIPAVYRGGKIQPAVAQTKAHPARDSLDSSHAPGYSLNDNFNADGDAEKFFNQRKPLLLGNDLASYWCRFSL